MKGKCKKCGKRCKHTCHKLEMPHPEGGVTVLGRRVPLIPVIGYSQCSSCGHRQTLNIQFPLDEDAMLIGELFSVDLSDKDELEFVVEWLKANKIGPDDLAELKRLKDGKTVTEVLEWWNAKGLPTPELVVEDDAEGTEREVGGVRFLRPPETTNDGSVPGDGPDRREVKQ